MAIVQNVSKHAIGLSLGTLGPGEQRNLDVSGAYEQDLINQGILVVVNALTSPPAPIPPAPTEFRRVRLGRGAAAGEPILEAYRDGETYPRVQVTVDGGILTGSGASVPSEIGGGNVLVQQADPGTSVPVNTLWVETDGATPPNIVAIHVAVPA